MVLKQLKKRLRHRTMDLERRYFGLNRLDRKLEAWLDFDGGTFVEAGANNGTSQSNTCYFERYRGWSGLLVEPVAEKAEECRRNRPNSIVENCALGPPEQDGDDVTLTFCNLMTVTEGSMQNERERDAHVATGSKLQDVEPYEFTVTCRTLSGLLGQHDISRIDLLSLDVEGFEPQVLRGIDFERHKPHFILVEAREEDAVRELLAPRYDEVAKLNHHDILFVVKSTGFQS